ncbi:Protein bfr2 [Talaromyces atroroseus]|uniref:Protein BFR2 n=1 Tax=Talaromyces atroroseus TaxID=1441469 RepID=A0A225AKP4_TALAT|nr:Protein bfr2 [Talaromyces atroroseus]OKL61450.1 Protein bfr2 [Talaromyces atroroseus]
MPTKTSSRSKGFKSLVDQLADLEDPTPKDFDPEDPDTGHQDSDDESESEVDENTGREHYENVGKSKLRKPETVILGKEYAGSRVSRDALEDLSDDNDPFQRLDSDENDDDEEEGISESSEDKEEQHEGDSEGDLSDDDDDDDDDDMSASDQDDNATNNGSMSDERAELRKLMATDQKTVAATISEAAKADAAKGFAVKQQRVAFDALLNARIKLQKGLTAISDSSNISWETEEENSDAIQSAESAALALWSSLEELRVALAEVQSKEDSKKRKRLPPVSLDTSSESIWQRMQNLETKSQIHRRAVLEKWNHKVRGTNANLPNARGKLVANSGNNSIIAVLEAHVATEVGDRATKKQRTSEASGSSYDDSAFYQSLLRDLVEQRMSSSDAVTNGLDALHLQIPAHSASGMRKDKVHKNVDTKASKGRKMRYNVHEKLQNFMAPEDRGTWSSRARDEFFASLLGKTASGLLGEADSEDEPNGVNGAASDEEDLEEGGLRLFRG